MAATLPTPPSSQRPLFVNGITIPLMMCVHDVVAKVLTTGVCGGGGGCGGGEGGFGGVGGKGGLDGRGGGPGGGGGEWNSGGRILMISVPSSITIVKVSRATISTQEVTTHCRYVNP